MLYPGQGVMVDPEPILGTLDAKWKYTLDVTRVHCKTPCTHTDTLIHTLGQFSTCSPSKVTVWETKEPGGNT